MDQDFPITRTWLVLALFFNASECWSSVVPFGLSAFIQHAAKAEQEAAGEPVSDGAHEADATMSQWKIYFGFAALGRLLSIASLLWLFQWRRFALGCFLALVVWNLAIDVLGFDLITLLIDLALVAVLALILTVIEPDAREELS